MPGVSEYTGYAYVNDHTVLLFYARMFMCDACSKSTYAAYRLDQKYSGFSMNYCPNYYRFDKKNTVSITVSDETTAEILVKEDSVSGTDP